MKRNREAPTEASSLTCHICMQLMDLGGSPEFYTSLSCGHVFCLTCLRDWMRHTLDCPTCCIPVDYVTVQNLPLLPDASRNIEEPWRDALMITTPNLSPSSGSLVSTVLPSLPALGPETSISIHAPPPPAPTSPIMSSTVWHSHDDPPAPAPAPAPRPFPRAYPITTSSVTQSSFEYHMYIRQPPPSIVECTKCHQSVRGRDKLEHARRFCLHAPRLIKCPMKRGGCTERIPPGLSRDAMMLYHHHRCRYVRYCTLCWPPHFFCELEAKHLHDKLYHPVVPS